MSAYDDLIAKQEKWAEKYCERLTESNLSFEASQAEADRKLKVLRDLQIDPYSAEEWSSPALAAGEYLRSNPIEKSPVLQYNIWQDMSLTGTLLCGAALWMPFSDWMQGTFEWQIAVSGELFIGAVLVFCILITLGVTRAIYVHHGVWPTVPALALCVCLCTSVVYLPTIFWEKTLKITLFYMPFWVISSVVIVIGLLLIKLGDSRGAKAKQRALLRDFDLRKNREIGELNREWFKALNVELRNSYHFSSKMVTKTLTELRQHLDMLGGDSADDVSAEEEFGPIAEFAYELARNNQRALVNTCRFNLLIVLFYLIIGIIVTVCAIGSWWQYRRIVSLLIGLPLGLGMIGVFTCSSIEKFKLWRQVCNDRI